MSKITFENKKGKLTITNKLSYPEAVNERVYNAIVSGMFEGLLPVSIRQKRKETMLECVVQGMVPLSYYFNGIVTKKMFLDFVHELATVIKDCEKNMVSPSNLDLHRNMIFVNPKTKQVKCVFWPVVNNQRDTPPEVFLKQLPQKLTFNPHESKDYIQTYNAFFTGITPFSVNSFERMILRLLGKQSNGYSAPSEALSGSQPGMAKAPDAKQSASIEYDPFASIQEEPEEIITENKVKHDTDWQFCTSCGNKNSKDSNFCVYCGSRLKGSTPVIEHKVEPKAEPKPEPKVEPKIEPKVEPKIEPKVELKAEPRPEPKVEPVHQEEPADMGTVVLGYNYGGTTVLGYDDPPAPPQVILSRINTGETYLIDKPLVRLGSLEGYCTLIISGNKHISKCHADIITRNDRYYIMDQNSTNHTYVDGRMIPAKVEVEIFAGTKIRLANDDFIFTIES